MDIILPLIAGVALVGLFSKKTGSSELSVQDGMLGKYFDIDEFTRSPTCSAHNEHNEYTSDNIFAALNLVYYIGDPLRECLGGRLIVNSWFRNPQCNDLVGGADESNHMDGGTFDVKYLLNGERRNDLIIRCLIENDLPFDRIILEYGTLTRPQWVHIEYNVALEPDQQRGIIYRLPDDVYYTKNQIMELL
jgi:hypothetical protein